MTLTAELYQDHSIPLSTRVRAGFEACRMAVRILDIKDPSGFVTDTRIPLRQGVILAGAPNEDPVAILEGEDGSWYTFRKDPNAAVSNPELGFTDWTPSENGKGWDHLVEAISFSAELIAESRLPILEFDDEEEDGADEGGSATVAELIRHLKTFPPNAKVLDLRPESVSLMIPDQWRSTKLALVSEDWEDVAETLGLNPSDEVVVFEAED